MLADGGDEGFPAAMAADDKGVVPRRLQGGRKVDEAADTGDAGHRAARDVREQGGQAEKADVAGHEDGHGPFLIGQRSGKLTNIVTPVRRDQALPGSRKRRQHPLVADEDGRSLYGRFGLPRQQSRIAGPCADNIYVHGMSPFMGARRSQSARTQMPRCGNSFKRTTSLRVTLARKNFPNGAIFRELRLPYLPE